MDESTEKVQEDNSSIDASTTVNNSAQEETTVEETYKTQYLIDNCKALGYKKEIVAGAFLNCEKTEMTKTEFEATIKNFLGKKVK
jgi:hypothetical protein